jgi:hypothetical protein
MESVAIGSSDGNRTELSIIEKLFSFRRKVVTCTTIDDRSVFGNASGKGFLLKI